MKMIDRRLQALTAHESHRVVRPVIVVGAQAVHRHNPRVLESTRDLGFEQEPLAAHGVVGVRVEDLLERHLAVELGIERDEHGSEPAAGMGPQNPEALTT